MDRETDSPNRWETSPIFLRRKYMQLDELPELSILSDSHAEIITLRDIPSPLWRNTIQGRMKKPSYIE